MRMINMKMMTMGMMNMTMMNITMMKMQMIPCHCCPPVQSLRSHPTGRAPRSCTAMMDPDHPIHHHIHHHIHDLCHSLTLRFVLKNMKNIAREKIWQRQTESDDL